MSTAPTKSSKPLPSSKPALDSAQRAWLAKMGIALQAPVSQADAVTSQAGAAKGAGGAVQTAQSPPDPNAEKFEKETLKIGAKGPAVEHLQKLLKDNGAAIEADGKFGPATETAVKAFQKGKSLSVDGIVGQKTWTALKASKPAPPAPPDTRPRRAVFIVTDAATNDAVEDATVKVGDQTEKTGNTGQAILSLPPGQFVFGVTAEGFEQAADKFDVTANDESQVRVELKAGERRSKTILKVKPPGTSNKGDKLELEATVTIGTGKTAPTGTVRFDVILNGTSRKELAKVPVKDGKAVHVETLLPTGVHELDATFTPTPETKDNVGSQSERVKHEIVQTEQGQDKEIAKRIIAALNEDDDEALQKEIGKLQFRAMGRVLNIMALLQKAGKLKAFLEGANFDTRDRERILVAILTMLKRFERDWFKRYSTLSPGDRKAILARTPKEAILAFELENDPVDPPDPNAEPDDPNAKIVIDKGINTKATIEFRSQAFGSFGTTEIEVKIGPNGKMKSTEVDMTVVKAKLKKVSALGPVLDLEGKLSVGAGVERKEDKGEIVDKVQAAVKAEVEVKFPEIVGLENVKFVLGVKFTSESKFEAEVAVVIPIPSLP